MRVRLVSPLFAYTAGLLPLAAVFLALLGARPAAAQYPPYGYGPAPGWSAVPTPDTANTSSPQYDWTGLRIQIGLTLK